MGRRIVGRHERLIDRDTFDAVQAHLIAKRAASDRPSKHEHYLRGSLFCADCGGRLLYTRNTGRGGTYEYFSCINRRSRGGRKRLCERPHHAAEKIETEVIGLYKTVRLSKRVQDQIRADIQADAEERLGLVEHDIEKHQRALEGLEAQQVHLLEKSFKGLVSDTVLAAKQRELEREQARIGALMGQLDKEADDIGERIEDVLNRTISPSAVYRAGTPLERRILNQAFFKQIFVGEDGEVLGTALTPAYAAVAAWEPKLGQPASGPAERPTRGEDALGDQEAGSTNPGPLSRGQGFVLPSNGGGGGNRTPN